jgi:hypothetical protein
MTYCGIDLTSSFCGLPWKWFLFAIAFLYSPKICSWVYEICYRIFHGEPPK